MLHEVSGFGRSRISGGLRRSAAKQCAKMAAHMARLKGSGGTFPTHVDKVTDPRGASNPHKSQTMAAQRNSIKGMRGYFDAESASATEWGPPKQEISTLFSLLLYVD